MDKEDKKKSKKPKKNKAGFYSDGPAKGHLDTQLFPGFDRNIVKKTVEKREKNISPYSFNLKEYRTSQVDTIDTINTKIDKNTIAIGRIKSINDAKKICIEKWGKIPSCGNEMIIDEGNNPKYRTYLQNNSGSYKILTWIENINLK